MSDKVDLKVDFCSYEAAKYAVEHWHYSKTMPAGKTVKIGAWEDDKLAATRGGVVADCGVRGGGGMDKV
jgi:hypothetical protein